MADTTKGVIPRAAAALFEKLTGNPQSRIAGSGLRAPARYSTAGLGALQNFSKNIEKNWTLKATYVEVGKSFVEMLVDGISFY